jgi:hypothetical protein
MARGSHRLRQPRIGAWAALVLAAVASVSGVAVFGDVAGATTAAPVITHPTRAAVTGDFRTPHSAVRSTWASSNWSGYATTSTVTGITGTWTVPAVAATSSATYSSTWVGVDGFSNSNLIQTGTEQDYYSGAAHYSAWWEILPAAETIISPNVYRVTPGDRMSASIYETSATVSTGFFRRTSEHVWSISISDTTKGWTYRTNQAYAGTGTSAEWIQEAPEVNGRIAALAHYTFKPPATAGDFDNAGVLTTIVSSGTPKYTGAALNYQNNSGVMIQNGVQVSTPGNPDTALTAFNAAYGPSLPATPTS